MDDEPPAVRGEPPAAPRVVRPSPDAPLADRLLPYLPVPPAVEHADAAPPAAPRTEDAAPAQSATAAAVPASAAATAGCRRIAVVSRSGGVGKTTTAVLLAAALAAPRGARVVAVDADPGGGLGERAGLAPGATRGRVPTIAPAVGADVVADATWLREPDARSVVAQLARRYHAMVFDTRTGLLADATQALLAHVDQVVVVTVPAVDAVRGAVVALEWLHAHGHAGLATVAVTAIVAPPARGPIDVERVAQVLASRCRDVVALPWDSALASGGALDPAALRPETRAAFLRLAAVTAGEAAQ